VALAAAVVLAGISFASAAGLGVDAGSLWTGGVQNPCPQGAQAVATSAQGNNKYDDVTVTLDARCSGWLQVTVLENGLPLVSTAQTVVAGEPVVPVVLAEIKGNGGGYFPKDISVVAALDGWNLPTTWSYD